MMPFKPYASTLRLALTYMAVFALSVLVLAVVTYSSVQHSLEAQLRQHIQDELSQLLVDYEEDGLEELRHDISENIESATSRRMHYTLVSPLGRMAYDRMKAVPAQEGWHFIEDMRGKNLLVYKTDLKDGYALIVGHDLEGLASLQSGLRNNFAIVLVLTILIGMTGSVLVSRRFIARVARFERTAHRVGRGALSERIALTGSGDSFDTLAMTINTMLDRIEQLVMQIQQVSSNIAHDMRTPLGRIRLRLETLQEELVDAPQRQAYCRETIAMLDDSLGVFSSILRIAQIESAAQKSAFSPVDVSVQLHNTLEAFRPVLEEKNITLLTDIAPGAMLFGDATLLSQAWVNVIDNMMVHAAGATRLQVTLKNTPKGLDIQFADNGPGVPAAMRDRLVQAFFRADPSRSTGGNGLGLSLVSAIIALHDGVLSFDDNRPGLVVRMAFKREAA